ncbi:MAG: hypothetical protein HFJ75_07805 [Eggerthellaceae bacterium]|nr:hypothetical protein [Eggerthellaceae bacterium]
MAIQHRRGVYTRFDPKRLVAGEWAIVLSGDPIASDGMAAYICFASGTVKRVATYEDMADFFAQIKDDAVAYVYDVSTADARAEYERLRDLMGDQEAARVLAEEGRVSAEELRVTAEEARAIAEAARAASEEGRDLVIKDFEQKVADGFFDGATFRPAIDELGNLSWSNDKGLENPATVNIKGEKGNDGVVTELSAGMYALQVEPDGHLWLVYGDGASLPDLSISDDGHLWLGLEG